MSEHLLILDSFAGDIAGKIMLLDDPAEAIIHAIRGGAKFRLSLLASSGDDAVRFVLAPEPARQADGRDAAIVRLVAEVERHRMTEEERDAAGECADDSYEVASNYNSVSIDCVSDAASQSLRGYLNRTAPKEPSNG